MLKRCYRFVFLLMILGLFSIAVIGYAAGGYTVDGIVENWENMDIAASDEPAIAVSNGGILFMKNSTISQTTTDTTISITGSVTVTTESNLELSDVQIDNDATLTNAVFSTGAGSIITLRNVTIDCSSTSARGIYTQNGGTIIANNVTVDTYKGGGGAAAATSGANGGTIIINGGAYTTYAGMGSAAIYSTGNIIANNAVLTANIAEGACVEGPYSVALNNSSLSAVANNGVSFAKSPLTGSIPDGTSHFSMTGGKLYSYGNLFYCPNSYADILLQGVKISTDSGVILTTVYSGGGPGNDPSRGSSVNLITKKQMLQGDIICDSESKIMISMENSVLKGAIDNANSGGIITLKLDKNSMWEVTADSYITVLMADKQNKPFKPGMFNITCPKDVTVYYDSAVNEWLGAKTYKLPGGGTLSPL